jgi:protein-disulfide isomerase
VILLVIPVAWFLLKPVLLSAKESIENRNELARLKYNGRIFKALLEREKKITHDPGNLGIVMGNPHGAIRLTKVCNPYCGPCSKAHPEIDELIRNNPDIRVQVIFTAKNVQDNPSSEAVRHFMAVHEKGDKLLTHQMLHDWYTQDTKDFTYFASKYVVGDTIAAQDQKLEAMSNWCQQTEITFTPTFFINGFQLPDIYRITDVKHLLPTM